MRWVRRERGSPNASSWARPARVRHSPETGAPEGVDPRRRSVAVVRRGPALNDDIPAGGWTRGTGGVGVFGPRPKLSASYSALPATPPPPGDPPALGEPAAPGSRLPARTKVCNVAPARLPMSLMTPFRCHFRRTPSTPMSLTGPQDPPTDIGSPRRPDNSHRKQTRSPAAATVAATHSATSHPRTRQGHFRQHLAHDPPGRHLIPVGH